MGAQAILIEVLTRVILKSFSGVMPLELALAGKGFTAVASRTVPWVLAFQWNPMDSLFESDKNKQDSRCSLDVDETDTDCSEPWALRSILTTVGAMMALSN